MSFLDKGESSLLFSLIKKECEANNIDNSEIIKFYHKGEIDMKVFKYLLIVCLLFMFVSCKKDIPKPETNLDIFPIINTDLSTVVPVSTLIFNENDPFYVRHQVKDNNVLIECIVPGITFRNKSTSNRGKIIIYVDGKKKEEISSAAFIIKGLPSGTHRLKLEAIKIKDSSFHLQREFYVTIP